MPRRIKGVGIKGVARQAQRNDQRLRKDLQKVLETSKSIITQDKKNDGRLKAIQDSFQNFAANLGVGSNNIGAFDTYGFNPITRVHTLLEWIHRGSWVGGVAVDIVADDMTRAGVDITGPLDPEKKQAIEEEAIVHGVWTRINECIKWGRLYGGSIGLILIDGQDVETPFRIETVKKGMFKGILPLDRWMIEPDLTRLVTDYGYNLGYPSRYRVNASAPAFVNKWLHHTRCVRFGGIRLPYWQALIENLWDLSVLERLYDRMTAFDSATTGAAQLVHKLHVRTYKLKDFREIVSAGGDAMQGLARYVDMMRKFQSIEGMTLLDGEDEYEVHGSPAVAGVADLIDKFGAQLAGALQVPLVRLFGMSPAGMNATGESDMRIYYDGIKQQQEQILRVPVTTFYRCIAQSLGVDLPDGFGLNFNPLWQLSDKEKMEVAGGASTAVTQAFEAGLITQQRAMSELRQTGEVTGVFSSITEEEINAAEEELPPGLPPEEETAAIKSGGDPEAIAADASAPRIPAKQAGYVELPGATKDGDCQVVAVMGGVSLKMGCCNNFKLGAGAKQLFSCGTCKFHEDQIRSGADAAHDSAMAMAWHHDIPVVIENPKGSERRGRGWIVHMPADYGYIRRITGADGAELDCYVGPAPESDKVFIINQRRLGDGVFDEHKVMFGYYTQGSAIEDYNLGYPDGTGPKRMMDCFELSMDNFKKWLQGGSHNHPFRVTDAWEETQHPRAASGPHGGEFVARGAGGGGGVRGSEIEIGRVLAELGSNRAKLKSLYEKGLTPKEIAQKYNLPNTPEVRGELRAILKRAGAYKEKGGLIKPEQHEQVKKLYKGGWTTGDIALRLGLERNSKTRTEVRNILRKAGVYKERGGLKKVEKAKPPISTSNSELARRQMQFHTHGNGLSLQSVKSGIDRMISFGLHQETIRAGGTVEIINDLPEDINNALGLPRDQIAGLYNANERKLWMTEKGDSTGTFIHEYGHHLTINFWRVVQSAGWDSQDAYGARADMLREFEKAQAEATAWGKKEFGPEWSIKGDTYYAINWYVVERLAPSSYAFTNQDEWQAEAFRIYFGTNPERLKKNSPATYKFIDKLVNSRFEVKKKK